MKILIIQLYRLGDVLQTTPVLQALKKKYGSVSIDFVVDETCAAVVKDNPYISRLFVLPRKNVKENGKNDFLTGFREISAFFGEITGTKYDLAVNYNFNTAGGMLLKECDAVEKRGLIYEDGKLLLLDEWTKYLFAINDARKYSCINVADVFKLIAGCGSIKSSLYLKSVLSGAVTRSRFLNFERKAPVAAVQGFGSRMFRSLSARDNEELIHKLEKNFNVALLGAKGEERRLGHLKDTGVFKNLTGKTSLEEFISVIKNSDILLTPDTFAMHAAAALGTRTVAYFLAGISPYETGPYAAGPYIIYRGSSCSPCPDPDKCGDRVCANGITPEFLSKIAGEVVFGNELKSAADGINVLRPRMGEFLYFNDEHRESVDNFRKIIYLTKKWQKPIIPVEKPMRDGTRALLKAMERLNRDMEIQKHQRGTNGRK
jgi:ADP-heptose:LPS heptosyltransferase